jgi:hypothetical protein
MPTANLLNPIEMAFIELPIKPFIAKANLLSMLVPAAAVVLAVMVV